MAEKSIDILLNSFDRTGPAIESARRGIAGLRAEAASAAEGGTGGIVGLLSGHLLKELAGGVVALHAVKAGFELATAGAAGMRGETKEAVEALERLPVVGRFIIQPFMELKDVLTGAKEAAKEIEESTKRQADSLRRIVELRRENAAAAAATTSEKEAIKGGGKLSDELFGAIEEIEKANAKVAEARERLREFEAGRPAMKLTETSPNAKPFEETLRQAERELATQQQKLTEIMEAQWNVRKDIQKKSLDDMGKWMEGAFKDQEEKEKNHLEELRKIAEIKRHDMEKGREQARESIKADQRERERIEEDEKKNQKRAEEETKKQQKDIADRARELREAQAENHALQLDQTGAHLDAELTRMREHYNELVIAARAAGNEELAVELEKQERLKEIKMRADADDRAREHKAQLIESHTGIHPDAPLDRPDLSPFAGRLGGLGVLNEPFSNRADRDTNDAERKVSENTTGILRISTDSLSRLGDIAEYLRRMADSSTPVYSIQG